MEGFTVRPAHSGDAEQLAEIHIRSWEYAYSGFLSREILDKQAEKRPKMWQKLCLNNVDSQFAVVLNGQIIGTIGLDEVRDGDLPKSCFELQGIYFAPEFVGLGYGTLAMGWVFNEVLRRGYDMISLWVFEKNTQARRFYEHCGYTLDTAAHENEYHGERVVRYTKMLR